MLTIQEIEDKLQKLRDEYKDPETTISRQETILLQARALKIAREKLLKKKTDPNGQMRI